MLKAVMKPHFGAVNNDYNVGDENDDGIAVVGDGDYDVVVVVVIDQ